MSSSGPSKQCPRCGTLLFEEMPSCRACGWEFSSAPGEAAPSNAPPSEFIPYDAPDPMAELPLAPTESAIQHPTGALSPNQAGYGPAAQPAWMMPLPGGYLAQGPTNPIGYTPAPLVAAPTRRAPKALLLFALMVLLIGAAAGGIFLNFHPTSSTSTAIFDRHGLQANVPLPGNIAFQYKHTVTQGTVTADEWIWKVSKSEPASLQQFYQNQLPNNGWTHLQTIPGDTLGVIGCQGAQVLVIGISKHLHDSNNTGTSTIITDAPAGGSSLGIALTSNQTIIQDFCESQP